MHRCLLIALVLTACGSSTPPPTESPGVSSMPSAETPTSAHELAWLEGTWVTENLAGEVQGELWQTNTEGGLVGRGFTRRPLIEHTRDENPHALERTTEVLEIGQRADAYVYVASPVGQARTEFVITTLEPDHLIAENPTHDFPTRIEYTREGQTLTAHVSSSTRAFSIVFARSE